MKEKKTKFKRSVLHKIAIALLTIGFVLSISTFLIILVSFLTLGTIYLAAILVFLLIVGVIYLVVGGVIVVLFGLINYIIVFIEAIIMALAGKTSSSFDGFWPEIDWHLVSNETWQTFGICSAIGAFILLILLIVLIASFNAIIPSFVAFLVVTCSKKKPGLIIGGIFALLAAFIGPTTLIEFVGAILAFIAKGAKPIPVKDKPKLITNN